MKADGVALYNLEQEVATKADADHTHTAYATKSELAEKASIQDVSECVSSICSNYADAATVSGIQNSLAGKADVEHTHNEADVNGLIEDLEGKANTTHTHTQDDITGLTAALNGKVSVAAIAGYATTAELNSAKRELQTYIDSLNTQLTDKADNVDVANLEREKQPIIQPIETLTGTSVTIEAGHRYRITLTADTTITPTPLTDNYGGDCVIDITTGTFSVTAGTGLTMVDALVESKLNHCVVRWDGAAARLYVAEVQA